MPANCADSTPASGKKWILEREHLKGFYSYDEIDSLLVFVLKDGVIEAGEHEALMAFFNDFIFYSLSARVKNRLDTAREKEKLLLSKSGICAIGPEINFEGRVFVFTRMSERAPRKESLRRVVKNDPDGFGLAAFAPCGQASRMADAANVAGTLMS